jgi:hypothetical protein
VSEELFEAFQPSPAPAPTSEANPSKTGRKKRGPRRQAAPTAAPVELPPIAPAAPAPAEAAAPARQKRQYTRRAAAPSADDLAIFSSMFETLTKMDKRSRDRILQMLAKVFA